MLAGMDDTTIKRGYEQLSLALAERLGSWGNLGDSFAKKILQYRGKNPLEVAKYVAFLRYIILNPARQLLLQSQQATVALGLEHGMKYFLSGRGIREHSALLVGISSIDRPRLWRQFAPAAAKLAGVPVKEYKKLVEAFKKSGMPDGVDSHAFVMHMAGDPRLRLSETLGAKLVDPMAGALQGGIHMARKVGFDAGEINNLTFSWLAVRNKWIKNNPGKDWSTQEALDEIAGQTRAITLNMNAAGTLQTQRGLMGLMFQFMSHTSKAIQVVLPGKLGDKSFSKAEKFRILLSQLALYGSGGYALTGPINDLRDELGIEWSPEVNRAIEEGITGNLMNAMFHMADAETEDTSLSFSDSFGPFSGGLTANPVWKVASAVSDAALTGSADWMAILPPAMSSIRQVGETAKTVNFILGGLDLPEEESKALLVLEQALTVSGGYDNFLQARMASRMGEFVSRAGNAQVRATGGEILAKGLVGIRSKKQVQLSEELRELRGISTTTQEGLNRKIDGYAKEYVTLVMKVLKSSPSGIERTPAEFYDALGPHITLMKEALNEGEWHYFTQRVQERLWRDRTDNNETRMTKEVMRMLGQGEDIGGSLATRVKNMEEFEGKTELVGLLERLEDTSALWETIEEDK